MPVIDASIIIAALAPDEHQPEVRRVFESALEAGASAPALLIYEITNVLQIKTRRRIFDIGTRDRLLRAFAKLPIRYEPPDAARAAQSIVPLAAQLDLSVYDAAYVELAARLDQPLASRDGPMCKAAERVGIRLL